MSKTVKELAGDAVATYVRKYPEFDVIASERDYLAGLFKRALVEHEKAVREEIEPIVVFFFDLIERGELVRNTAQDDEPGFAPRMMKLVMMLKKASEIRSRKPADTEGGA